MTLQIAINGRLRKLELTPDQVSGRYLATLDGEPLTLEVRLMQPGVMSLLIGDRAYRCVLEESDQETAIQIAGRRFPYTLEDPRSLRSRRGRQAGADGPALVKAPMPGRVVRTLAAKGDAIAANQGVVVIEAMKMQNELKSPKAGTLAELRVAPGETVTAGQVLAVIE